MKKRTAAIAGTVLVLLGLAVGVGPAVAATPGVPYDGTDPASTGCSAGATVIGSYPVKDSSGNVDGTLEVRYSSTCNTNWVRLNNTISGTVAAKNIFRISTYNAGTNTGLPADDEYASDAGLGWSYTNQVGGADVDCVEVWGNIDSTSGTVIADSGTFTLC